MVLVAVVGASIGSAVCAAGEDAAPAAIVCLVDGEAWVHSEDGPRALALFDWVASGAQVETGDDGRLILGLGNGERWLLHASSAALVTAEGVERKDGRIEQLAPVGAIPAVVGLLHDRCLSERPAADRIRGAGLRLEVYPRGGAAVRARRALLAFEHQGEMDGYSVEVRNATDEAVFTADTCSSEVAVPVGVLRPGSLYILSLVAERRGQDPLRRSSVFRTIPENEEQVRGALAEAVAATGDASLILLLAELDSRLRLDREACQGLETASGLAPGNAAIAGARESFGCTSIDTRADE